MRMALSLGRLNHLLVLSLENDLKIETGYIFLNRFGERITTRGIAQQLKNYAVKYKLNPKVVYPHSFRHRFAKNFLERFNDLALLADLMGHESIETTKCLLDFWINQYEKEERINFAIELKENGKMIGTCGYANIDSS